MSAESTVSELGQRSAEASIRANQAEEVARATYYADPEMSAYSRSVMRRERDEARRLLALAQEVASAEGGVQ